MVERGGLESPHGSCAINALTVKAMQDTWGTHRERVKRMVAGIAETPVDFDSFECYPKHMNQAHETLHLYRYL